MPVVIALALVVLSRDVAGGRSATALARQRYAEAEKAYGLGRFDEALVLYQRAFELKPLPGFLFNMGQCERNLGRHARARFFYQRFLAVEPKARNRAVVERLIEEMTRLLREKEAALDPAVDVPAPLVAAAREPAGGPLAPMVPPPNVVPDAAASTQPAPARSAQSAPLHRTWWFWTAAGVVVLGGVAGVTLAVTNPIESESGLSGTIGGPIDARR